MSGDRDPEHLTLRVAIGARLDTKGAVHELSLPREYGGMGQTRGVVVPGRGFAFPVPSALTSRAAEALADLYQIIGEEHRSRTVPLKLVGGQPTGPPSSWHQSAKESDNG